MRRQLWPAALAGNSRRLPLAVEQLEGRTLLSATSALADMFAESLIEPAAVNHPTPVGLTPAQVKAAYGINQITVPSGQLAGAGQTIAIINAYDNPNIRSDLALFSTTFGLPAANLTIAKQYINGAAPRTDSGWAGEIALDVEWAHAIAPGANILLVEANSASLSNLLAAVDYARNQPGVSVISMSWGASEFSGEASYDSHFTTPAGHTPITFIAASGDGGAGAMWPAVSTNVIGVGGTTLNQSSGTYISETAWSGSGGAYSRYIVEPSYQTSVQSTGRRGSPDVAYDANPNTGFAVYDTVPDGNQTGWFQIGGTSAGAPQWAALIAIVNQNRVAAGKSTLSNAPAAIYSLPSADFHDITTGSNGLRATAGYDPVTGRGTPIARLVVQGLVGATSATTLATTAGTSGLTRLLASATRNFVVSDEFLAASALDASSAVTESANAVARYVQATGQIFSPNQNTGFAPTTQPMAEQAAVSSNSLAGHGWLTGGDAVTLGDASPSLIGAKLAFAPGGLDGAGAASTGAAPLMGAMESSSVRRTDLRPLAVERVDAYFSFSGAEFSAEVSIDGADEPAPPSDEAMSFDFHFDDGSLSNVAGLVALAFGRARRPSIGQSLCESNYAAGAIASWNWCDSVPYSHWQRHRRRRDLELPCPTAALHMLTRRERFDSALRAVCNACTDRV